jgi:hypothetical protein
MTRLGHALACRCGLDGSVVQDKGIHMRKRSIPIFLSLAIIATGLSAGTDAALAVPKTYGAVVKSTGAFARGTTGVTGTRLNAGVYNVNFPVAMTKCIFNATVGSWNAASQDGGFAKVGSVSGKPKSVLVVTLSNGTPVDRSFHLTVFCP